MEVLLNSCYGGFSLSTLAIIRYYELKGIKVFVYKIEYDNSLVPIKRKDILENSDNYLIYRTDKAHKLNEEIRRNFLICPIFNRTDKDLLKVFWELKDKANGTSANLTVQEIPDGVDFYIEEYDGIETIIDYWITVTLEELAKGLSKEQLEIVKQGASIKTVNNIV